MMFTSIAIGLVAGCISGMLYYHHVSRATYRGLDRAHAMWALAVLNDEWRTRWRREFEEWLAEHPEVDAARLVMATPTSIANTASDKIDLARRDFIEALVISLQGCKQVADARSSQGAAKDE